MLRKELVIFLAVIMLSSAITAVSPAEGKLPMDLKSSEDIKKIKDPEKLKALKKIKDPDKLKDTKKMRVIENENLIAYARALYTTLDSPSNHLTSSGDPYDGVAELILTLSDGTFGCSGALLPTGQHVLTAAHCVTDNSGNYNLQSGFALFAGDDGTITIDVDPANSLPHPEYDGDFLKGNDLSILKLVSIAPAEITRYNFATSGSAVNQNVEKIGYGISGLLKFGIDPANYPFGDKRDGHNRYDSFADTMYQALGMQPNIHYIPQAIYQYDSDDGKKNHDAFDFFFGITDTGLGTNEIISGPGDSGGPSILNGELVGITSYGITLQYTNGRTSDCTKLFGSTVLDSSCGEFAGDTRVSSYTAFIVGVIDPLDGDGVLEGDNCPNTSNPNQEDGDGDGIGDVCDFLPLDPSKQCKTGTGNWNDADSWFTNEIPTNLEWITLANCNLTVLGGETIVIDNILFVKSDSILNLDGDVTVNGDMNVQGEVNLAGTANINSNALRVFGTYNVQSGGIHNNNAAGFTSVRNGANFNLLSGGIVNDPGIHVTNAGGTTTVSGEWNDSKRNTTFGTFNVESGGVYDNSGFTEVVSGGNFNLQSGGKVDNFGSYVTQSGGTTTASGTWNEKSGAKNIVRGMFNVALGVVFNQVDGITKVPSGGNYNVQSGGIHNNNAAGFTDIRKGGNYNVQSGGTDNNAGIHVTRAGGTTTVSGEWNESKRNTTFGTFNVESGGVYSNTSFTEVINGGNFNLQSGGKVNNFAGFVTQSGGITTLDDDYDNNAGRTINFGTMTLGCTNGSFNDLGGIFRGTPIIDPC